MHALTKWAIEARHQCDRSYFKVESLFYTGSLLSLVCLRVSLIKQWTFVRKDPFGEKLECMVKCFTFEALFVTTSVVDCCELLDILVSDCLLFKNAPRDSSGTVIVNLEESF